MASLHNKIQTFNLGFPKSDIFLDLDLKPNKDKDLSSSDSNKIKVITLERPTPKLVIESESFFAQSQKSISLLQTKANLLFQNARVVLQHRIVPKLSRFQFCFEIILSNLIALLCLPILLLGILSILSVRCVVSLYLKFKYGDKYKLMSGQDAAWGFTKQFHDNCFTSMYIIKGNCSITKIRDRIKTSLLDRRRQISGSSEYYYVYEKMRSKITQKCGFYCWEQNPEFDIDRHVKLLGVDDNTHHVFEMDKDRLFQEMQGFMDIPLSQDLPPWLIYIVPRFKYGGGNNDKHYVLIWRINHSVMDGVSAINALQTCIADTPVRMSIDTASPSLNPTLQQNCYLYLSMLIFGSRLLIRSLLFGNQHNCFQGPELSGPKTVLWSRAIRFQSLRQIKNVMGSTTTSVLLSSFGGALRKLALKKNLPIPTKMCGGATSAVIPYPDYGPQNRFTVASFALNVGDECPIQRLKTAMQSVSEFGGVAETLKTFHMIRITGLLPVKAIAKIMNSLQATFLLSNIPGPAEKYMMFDGDEMVDIIGWNTIKGKTGIGLCLLSYAGKSRAALIVDGAVLPNQVDVDMLIQDFENELLHLAKTCGITEECVFVGP